MNYWRINFQPTTLVNHNRAMVTNTYSRWKVGAGTFVLWFLAVACVVFWGLKLSASQGLLGAPALAPTPTVVDTQALVRLLGGSPVGTTMAAAPTRYSLVGVLAGTRSGHGAALIEIDGKPAKPYRVGAQVTDGLVLQSVGRREAHLGAAMDGVSRRLQAIQGTERPPQAPEIFTCIFRAFVIWQAGLWPPPDCC